MAGGWGRVRLRAREAHRSWAGGVAWAAFALGRTKREREAGWRPRLGLGACVGRREGEWVRAAWVGQGGSVASWPSRPAGELGCAQGQRGKGV